MSQQELFGEVIYAYTRAQAIEDGVLVDLSDRYPDLVKSHYKAPVAVTASVWAIIEKAVNHPRWGNDYKGVIHDMLWMSRVYYREVNPQTRIFRVIITGAGRKRNWDFKSVAGPGDNGELVVTIMMPEED